MSAPDQQRPMHAPAPSLAMSAQQAASLHAAAGGSQQGQGQQPADLSDKLVRLKLDEQHKQQQQAAAAAQAAHDGGSSSGAAPAAAAAPAKKKEMGAVRYAAERVIGNGSFGVVYQATVIETGETVAIKKVLQDPKFKNRELQIMGMMNHCDVISLKHCFYSKGEKPDEVYLNLVMDYIPETIHRTLRTYTKANKLLPIMYTKVYMYQIARSLSYIHSLGVCHRDIKPQNLLLDTRTHKVLLCDFGSAKVLVPGEPNVSYICSRYYRAPELGQTRQGDRLQQWEVFEATQYTTSIDVWSLGCVMAEMLLGNPLFPGESAVDQLIEIIKILGTPTREEIYSMNPNHTCLLVGTQVRLANGDLCPVEQLKKGSMLLSSTGGSTAITDLAPGRGEDVYTVAYNLRGEALQHVVTRDHLVTLRCPRSPSIVVAPASGAEQERPTLRIEWLDSKTLKHGSIEFRLSSPDQPIRPEELVESPEVAHPAPILPEDVSAHARLFARRWLQTQAEAGSISPLYAGDLFDVPARDLHAWMECEHVAYVRDIISNLGVPVCFARASSLSSVDVPPSSSSVATSSNDASLVSARQEGGKVALDDVIRAFRDMRATATTTAPVRRVSTPEAEKPLLDQTEAGRNAEQISDVLAPSTFAASLDAAAGKVVYKPLVAGQQSGVVYVLHDPSSGADVRGNGAYALERLEEAWGVVRGVAQTDLFASGLVIARVEESADDEACLKSMEAALAAQPQVVAAFGTAARKRWTNFAKRSQLVQGSEEMSESEEGMLVHLTSGSSLTVRFAPHPTCSWLSDSMTRSIARAHGVELGEALQAELASGGSKLSSHACLVSVQPSGQGDYVSFAVDAGDRRFVLSDGAITHNSFKFPSIKSHPWPKVFRNKAPASAIDLVSKWLRYEPKSRLDPFESLAHPFFDELREPGAKMPNQQPVPEKLFDFTDAELKVMQQKGLTKKLIPQHLLKNYAHKIKL